MRRTLAVVALLAFGTLAGAAQPEPMRTVGFFHAPARHFSVICAPDDWQKTVVTGAGSLAYDFGPGPYAVPLTEVALQIAEAPLDLSRLFLESASVPVVSASFHAAGVAVEQRIFALPTDQVIGPLHPRVRRLGGLNGAVGWAPDSVPAPFRSAAWGTNRPIRYRVSVAPGSSWNAALGVLEPYKQKKGGRILLLRVEGAPEQRFDPLETAGRNIPHVLFFDAHDADGDGELSVEVHAAPEGDPNVCLSAFWLFPRGTRLTADDVVRGRADRRAEVTFDCGAAEEAAPRERRLDAILATVEGPPVTPVVRITSRRPLRFDAGSGLLFAAGRPFLASRPAPLSARRAGDTLLLSLPAGTRRVELVVAHGGAPAGQPSRDLPVPDLAAALAAAGRFWMSTPDVPRGRIDLPDPGLQYILDANIRNLYQVRERVDGVRQFQPGPSVYRGLWLHDAVIHIEAALYLGDYAAAREAVEGLMRFQLPDGEVRVMAPHVMQRETPLFAYALCRYGLLTQDRRWLEKHWPRVVQALEWVAQQRTRTLRDPRAPEYGLFPPGFADGGLAGIQPEYASTYWSLTALHEASRTARRIGKGSDAARWDALAATLLESFRRAAARDARRDRAGNLYLPMKVGDTSSTTPPQQAQWAFCEAVGLGGPFSPDDSLVRGTLAMLDADTAQGLPLNTGWLKDGVWPWFALMHGTALLRTGGTARAQDMLYAFANHASTLGTWVEEQLPRRLGTRTGGDASNASGSACYVALLRRMLIFERDSVVDILHGVPPEWFSPGVSLALNALPTEFGPMSLELRIAPDEHSAALRLETRGLPGGTALLHLARLRSLRFRLASGEDLPEVMRVPWGSSINLALRR